MDSVTLTERVKLKCYITDDSEPTKKRLKDCIGISQRRVKRMLGVDANFDFEATGNEEELGLFLDYCWYWWNDSSNEFAENYMGDIYSLRQKHEVEQYEETKEN